VTLFCFGYVAYLDYKFREVENWVWIIFGASGIVGTLLVFRVGFLYSIILSVFLAISIWILGGFGGADAKALITLSLLFPTGLNDSTLYFPLLSFMFACVLAMPHALYTIYSKEDNKKTELPLLFYLFFGILVSLFVGKWFINLIL